MTPTDTPEGIRRLGIGALAVLAGLGARAEVPRGSGPSFPLPKTIAVWTPTRGTGTEAPDWCGPFRGTLIRDLQDCGLFRLLDASGSPGAMEGLPDGKGAGSDLLLRTTARTLTNGMLALECECVLPGTRAVLARKLLVGEFRNLGRMAHRLADFVVGKMTGTPGVADSTILFSRSTRQGVREIYSVEKDGGGLRRWTSLGSLSTHPALSGDGRLAFVAYLGGPPRIWTQSGIRGPAVAVYPTRGAPGRELSDLAWSPNGKLLAFAQTDRLGGAELHVLDPGSGKDLALTSGGHLDRCPSWSPDGKSIAFLSDRSGSFQVYTLGLDGRTLRQVTRDPAPKTCVAWSPRGDRLAYAEAAGAACRIQLKDPGEGAPVQVPYDGGEVEALGWAPDGRWLVLGIHGGEGSSLAVLGLDGTLRPLGDRAHGNQGPQWVRHLPRADSKAGTPSPSTHSADTTTVRPFPKEMLRCQPPPNSPRS